MAKDDAPPPERPPAKRRHLEQSPDFWLRIWLQNHLTPSERRRIEEEIDRRRQARTRVERRIGLLIGPEGVTPGQLDALPRALTGATEIHHAGVPRRVHRTCKQIDVPVVRHEEPREVILNAQRVIACPRSAEAVSEVWEQARYAKHRRLAVEIILPNGETV